MTAQTLTEPLRVRLPAPLVAQLDAEANRRLLSRSALVRWVIVKGLGLLDRPGADLDAPATQQEVALC